MVTRLHHAILAGLMLGLAGSASAATQIFSGVDNGAVPGGSTTNSSIAQAAFLAAAGGLQVNLAVGSFDPQNAVQGIRNESANGNPSNPFSTTEGPGDQAIDIFGLDGISFNVAPPPPVGGVPEPASWALLIAGFGLVGAAMRRRQLAVLVA